MRISYVVSTMIFWWRENHLSFEQECQFLKSLGFGVELWPTIRGQDDCRYDIRNWPRLKAATEGMLVSMRSRNNKPNLEQWNEQIECAKMLGANIVTDLSCLGIVDSSINGNSDFAAEVVKIAEEAQVKLCLETGNLTALKQLGEKFDSVYYCLDTGFMNLDAVFSFQQYVDELVERAIHLHLTDNYGFSDDHQPPGLRGGIPRENWEYLLNALEKYDNDVIASLEMFPSLPSVMIRRASEFLFDEMKWPRQPQRQPGQTAVLYNPLY